MSHGHSFNLKRKLRETQELKAQNENNDQLVFVLQFILHYDHYSRYRFEQRYNVL